LAAGGDLDVGRNGRIEVAEARRHRRQHEQRAGAVDDVGERIHHPVIVDVEAGADRIDAGGDLDVGRNGRVEFAEGRRHGRQHEEPASDVDDVGERVDRRPAGVDVERLGEGGGGSGQSSEPDQDTEECVRRGAASCLPHSENICQRAASPSPVRERVEVRAIRHQFRLLAPF
jgi:hypothetical protein